MRVMLFGPNGQVGRSFTRTAQAVGWTLVPVDRSRVDLTVAGEAAACIRAERPDAVVNAAAYTAVDKAESEIDTAERVNAGAPGEMARACGETGIPILHISTDFVFDGHKDGPYIETDPTGPLSAYGRTKLNGEDAVRSGTGRHVILRTAWVFSEFGGNFVKTMLRLGAERDQLGIVDDQRGCPTSAHGIAGAVKGVLSAWGSKGPDAFGTFHYCGDEAVTWYGFARAVFDHAGDRLPGPLTVKPIATADYPTPVERPKNSVLCCEKIADVYGIARNPWRDDLRTVVDRLFD